MRILVVTNLFPPIYLGGFEIVCKEVVEGLRQRGYEVKVLTSDYRAKTATNDSDVTRELQSSFDQPVGRRAGQILGRFQMEWVNQRLFRRTLQQFHPQLVYFWNLEQVSVSLIGIANELGYMTCFYTGDNWIRDWTPEVDGWFGLWVNRTQGACRSILKKCLHTVAKLLGLFTSIAQIRFDNVQFASEYLRQNALQSKRSFTSSCVRYWGIDPAHFQYLTPRRSPPTRLLFVGQIVPQKGVHIAIEAMKILRTEYNLKDAHLDIFGSSHNHAYLEKLKRMVNDYQLTEAVQFCGMKPRNELAAIYQEHDIFIFPSVWDEPFGLVVLEAMASGLPVVRTATGGSAEVTEPEMNGLVFDKDRPEDCAGQIWRLTRDVELYERIRLNGRRTVETKFSVHHTMTELESTVAALIDPANRDGLDRRHVASKSTDHRAATHAFPKSRR